MDPPGDIVQGDVLLHDIEHLPGRLEQVIVSRLPPDRQAIREEPDAGSYDRNEVAVTNTHPVEEI